MAVGPVLNQVPALIPGVSPILCTNPLVAQKFAPQTFSTPVPVRKANTQSELKSETVEASAPAQSTPVLVKASTAHSDLKS